MATHSSILAWKIPLTEEPGRLQTIGRKESDMTGATEHSTAQNLLFTGSVISDPLRPYGLQNAWILCPSSRVCSNSCPLSQWCHPTISSSVIPSFSCLQSFPTSGSMFYASGGQSTGATASALFLQMNTQGWFCLVLTDPISFQSKGLSRVFSETTV